MIYPDSNKLYNPEGKAKSVYKVNNDVISVGCKDNVKIVEGKTAVMCIKMKLFSEKKSNLKGEYEKP